MVKILIIIIFSINVLFAQVEQSGSSLPGEDIPFNIDIANYPTGKEETRLDIFIKVPYSSIQFVKFANGFEGRYTITLTFFDEFESQIILEKFWNERIIADQFADAISRNNYNYSYRSFELKPGRYFLHCEIMDKDSKKDTKFKGYVNVYEYNKEVQLSDLIYISGISVNAETAQYIPKVSNLFSSSDSSISYIYEIYTTEARSVDIINNVKNEDNNVIYVDTQHVSLSQGSKTIEHEIKNLAISLGNYTLAINVIDKEMGINESISKSFRSRIFGFPASITDLDEAVQQMTYIASVAVIDDIEETASFEEKLDKFKSFWKQKDPSPGTDENELLNEYYRRVSYSNMKFKHYFEGWKTDMGMIYIILGPPNNVERYPFNLDSKPYEIWDYYDINKRFIFVDQTGFGDYRLLNQDYGDWYRYRP